MIYKYINTYNIYIFICIYICNVYTVYIYTYIYICNVCTYIHAMCTYINTYVYTIATQYLYDLYVIHVICVNIKSYICITYIYK